MSEAKCVNLMDLFGDRYKIGFDPACSAFNVPRDKLDPWYMVIPCKYGDISPHGCDQLQLFVEGHSVTRKRLKSLDCLTLNTEDEIRLSF